MDAFMQGLDMVLNMSTMLWCTFGSILGIILGALPGLTATMGIALVMPISFQLPAATGIFLHFFSAVVPPFPGTQRTSSIPGDFANAQATACSRPPEPITIAFMAHIIGNARDSCKRPAVHRICARGFFSRSAARIFARPAVWIWNIFFSRVLVVTASTPSSGLSASSASRNKKNPGLRMQPFS